MTMTSTGPFCDSSVRPSCCWIAVKMDGPEEQVAGPLRSLGLGENVVSCGPQPSRPARDLKIVDAVGEANELFQGIVRHLQSAAGNEIERRVVTGVGIGRLDRRHFECQRLGLRLSTAGSNYGYDSGGGQQEVSGEEHCCLED